MIRRKGKPNKKGGPKKDSAAPSKKRKVDDFLEIPSDDENILSGEEDLEEKAFADEEEDVETPDEKRLRLAKEYVAQVESELQKKEDLSDDEEDEEEDMGADALGRRLRQDVLKAEGRYKRAISAKYEQVTQSASSRLLGRHQLSTCCVSLTSDDSTVYSGSKDGNIIRWDVETGKKVHTFKGVPNSRKNRPTNHNTGRTPSAISTMNARAEGSSGHIGAVLTCSVSSDGQLLASGGSDHMIRIWDTRTNTQVRALKGHRDVVSGVAFRRGGYQLYSASFDRTVRVWDAQQLAYVESLFGHQTEIASIDALQQECALTSGGADRTLRLWKIGQESQLVYKAHTGSIDCSCLINDQMYLAGSQDGALSLWSSQKKKPVDFVKAAHSGQWICSVAALPYTDLAATGSSDGYVKLWECAGAAGKAPVKYSLRPIASVPVPGFVNALAFSGSGRFLVAGVGQEHRFGRWQRIPEARNGVHIISLRSKESK
eukprot:TRINITY_DN4166_c0_g1_i1.p1 TRINITY_DN4166_c0_g1~~TRINITY_DN4166_c0_g1_i1.p1  ORF type:complete len:486 (+),score=100.91 TRINITY_DN4166_c0_g1_i1:70-1527(+)